ncbi:MAG TPA: c-type cytochrome [Burkholderiaceae bacterium]|nr:c-type cytochrome [Burkholderiaceae bacterium]
MKNLPAALAVATLVLACAAARADDSKDLAMRTLAARSGCVACHTVEAGKPGPDGGKPIGPPWQDVAKRYRGQSDAQDKLVKTVLQGSNPYYAHWKDKVSGFAMPPNAVAISEADAKALVGWILKLP